MPLESKRTDEEGGQTCGMGVRLGMELFILMVGTMYIRGE